MVCDVAAQGDGPKFMRASELQSPECCCCALDVIVQQSMFLVYTAALVSSSQNRASMKPKCKILDPLPENGLSCGPELGLILPPRQKLLFTEACFSADNICSITLDFAQQRLPPASSASSPRYRF
jgi:hypothetical protein